MTDARHATPVEPLSLSEILAVISIPVEMKRVLCHLYRDNVHRLLDDVATGAIRTIVGLGRKQQNALLVGTDRVLDALYVCVRDGGCRIRASENMSDTTPHLIPKGMVLPVARPDHSNPSSAAQHSSESPNPKQHLDTDATVNSHKNKEVADATPKSATEPRRAATKAHDPTNPFWIQLGEGLFIPCAWDNDPICVPWREAVARSLIAAPIPETGSSKGPLVWATAPSEPEIALSGAIRATNDTALGQATDGDATPAPPSPSLHVDTNVKTQKKQKTKTKKTKIVRPKQQPHKPLQSRNAEGNARPKNAQRSSVRDRDPKRAARAASGGGGSSHAAKRKPSTTRRKNKTPTRSPATSARKSIAPPVQPFIDKAEALLASRKQSPQASNSKNDFVREDVPAVSDEEGIDLACIAHELKAVLGTNAVKRLPPDPMETRRSTDTAVQSKRTTHELPQLKEHLSTSVVDTQCYI